MKNGRKKPEALRPPGFWGWHPNWMHNMCCGGGLCRLRLPEEVHGSRSAPQPTQKGHLSVSFALCCAANLDAAYFNNDRYSSESPDKTVFEQFSFTSLNL